MKAREFLARKVKEPELALRNLIKEPLTVEELRQLAKRVGGAENLVAPKRRAEAPKVEDHSGEPLLQWLAADGGRVRRPIISTPKGVTLGFAADARTELESVL